MNDIHERDVWRKGQRVRRVIALVAKSLRPRVLYSDGGNTNRSCLLATFIRWAKDAQLDYRNRHEGLVL
jgi:hypothetical protein